MKGYNMKWIFKKKFKFGEMYIWQCAEKFIPFPSYNEKKSQDSEVHYEIKETRSGGKKIVYSNKPTDGWLCWVNSLGKDKGSTGEILVDGEQEGRVEVLVSSCCPVNNEWEYIIKAQEGVMLYVLTRGNCSNYYLIFEKNRIKKVYEEDENLYIDDNDLSDDFFKKHWLNLNRDCFKIK